MMKLFVLLFVLIGIAVCDVQLHCVGECQQGDPNAKMLEVMPMKLAERFKCEEAGECPIEKESLAKDEGYPCVNGMSADEYPCSGVNMMSFVAIKDLGGKSSGEGSDIWGWTDPEDNSEIAIVCVSDGTSFVDVSNPYAPSVLGFLASHSKFDSIWHDVKIDGDYAYIVSEAPGHGMQVFDLTQFRGQERLPVGSSVPQLTESAWYGEIGNTHNIVINEDTDRAYLVGTSTCRGGLHMVDISTPLKPAFLGCYSEDGYTHDAQCVIYDGPDKQYTGQEICFNYNEDTLTIVDVTDASNPMMISRTPYQGSQYTHQGWLLKDSRYLVLNDELDEMYRTTGDGAHTRSMFWNVISLAKPVLEGSFYSSETAIDHNLYIKDNIVYESNYCAGLRILEVDDIVQQKVKEIAWFDVEPTCSSATFHGTWSNYPYFESDTIIVNSIERGLFVLECEEC